VKKSVVLFTLMIVSACSSSGSPASSTSSVSTEVQPAVTTEAPVPARSADGDHDPEALKPSGYNDYGYKQADKDFAKSVGISESELHSAEAVVCNAGQECAESLKHDVQADARK